MPTIFPIDDRQKGETAGRRLLLDAFSGHLQTAFLAPCFRVFTERAGHPERHHP